VWWYTALTSRAALAKTVESDQSAGQADIMAVRLQALLSLIEKVEALMNSLD
jgi:hypothetical protein